MEELKKDKSNKINLKSWNNITWTDELYNSAIDYLKNGKLPKNFSHKRIVRFKMYCNLLELEEENGQFELWLDGREIIKKSDINQVLSKEYLENNFKSRDKFYEYISFYYIGISRADIMNFLKNQDDYKKEGRTKPKSQLNPSQKRILKDLEESFIKFNLKQESSEDEYESVDDDSVKEEE